MENITLKSLEDKSAILQEEIASRHEAVTKKFKSAFWGRTGKPLSNIMSRISLILTFVEGIKIGRTIFRTVSAMRK